MQQMIWYVILTEVVWFASGNRTLTGQMSYDIKSGGIAYGINKPYHYIFYVIAKHLGEITIKFAMFFTAGLVIGFTFVGRIPNFKLYQIPFALISFFLGIMISSFISMGISTLSFWIEDSTPFHWIYSKLIIVIGIMFPVELFPTWLQPVIKCSPIYVVTYGPAKLMIDFNWTMLLRVMSAQLIYFIVALFLLLAFFQRGVKKLNVNGG
jgi:ABC-2 type transport system permease protein